MGDALDFTNFMTAVMKRAFDKISRYIDRAAKETCEVFIGRIDGSSGWLLVP